MRGFRCSPTPADNGGKRSTRSCTLKTLVNEFLASKEDKVNAGELSPHTFRDYFATRELLIEHFERPSAKSLRKSRNEAGAKVFEQEEVLSLLDAAEVHLRAMMSLGLNCGFGNTDVGSLPKTAVGLDAGWVTFPALPENLWVD